MITSKTGEQDFTYYLQNKTGELKPVFSKPKRKHDSYRYNKGQIILIWYEEFKEN